MKPKLEQRIALFISGLGTEMIGDKTWETYMDGEYVRQTEYIDIVFVERDQAEIVQEQVSLLKTAKEKLHERYLAGAAEIDERIAKLLAVTHQPEAMECPACSEISLINTSGKEYECSECKHYETRLFMK